ncbi:Acyl carrier protein 1, mitochondrial, partial [Phlyctochytrium bullatum]
MHAVPRRIPALVARTRPFTRANVLRPILTVAARRSVVTAFPLRTIPAVVAVAPRFQARAYSGHAEPLTLAAVEKRVLEVLRDFEKVDVAKVNMPAESLYPLESFLEFLAMSLAAKWGCFGSRSDYWIKWMLDATIRDDGKKILGDDLTLDSHFITDLGLDSLDQVEITMALEDEFNIEIPDRDADEILTPRQAVEK